jgi:glycosyltransferase involved in cell wall biosynthesis
MNLGEQYQAKSLELSNTIDNAELQHYPKISIVVPSYNQGKYLAETLSSIRDQKYPNLQLIVIDGGSQDNSVDIIRTQESIIDYWVSERDNGQSHAINKGMAKSTGDILGWLNSDDLLLPGALVKVAKKFQDDPELDVVYGQRIIIDENGMDIGKWVVADAHSYILPYADFIPQETLYWRRSLWDKIGATINEDFQFAMDWELLMRFYHSHAKFKRLTSYTGAFRFHPEQKTVANIEEQGFNEMELIRKKFALTKGKQSVNRRFMSAQLIRFAFMSRLSEMNIK